MSSYLSTNGDSLLLLGFLLLFQDYIQDYIQNYIQDYFSGLFQQPCYRCHGEYNVSRDGGRCWWRQQLFYYVTTGRGRQRHQ